MARKRSTPRTAPAATKPSVVVALQKVLYNGEDPTLEMDGQIELVIKDERQLRPGTSWTAGEFATEQTLTVLCDNHIIESVNLNRFARSLREAPGSWKAEGAFSSLTLQYPSSASFSKFLKRREVSIVTKKVNSIRADVGTGDRTEDIATNTLQVYFTSHDDYSVTAAELEKLKILHPVVPLTRPHSVPQAPIGILGPRSAQLPRPSSAQLPRPFSAQPLMELTRRNSGFHPGRFLSTSSFRPLQRIGRGQLVHRKVGMPPPTVGISHVLRLRDRATSLASTERTSFPQEVHPGISQSQHSDTTSPHFHLDQTWQVLGSHDGLDSSYNIYGGSQEHIEIPHQQTPPINHSGHTSIQAHCSNGAACQLPRRLVPSVITPMTPPLFGAETTVHHFDQSTSMSNHLTPRSLQGDDTDNRRLLRSTGPQDLADEQYHSSQSHCQKNYINVMMQGLGHIHTIEQRLDTNLIACEPNPEDIKRILAEHADEFGRLWSALCKEGGS